MGFTSKRDNDDENNGLEFDGFRINFGGDDGAEDAFSAVLPNFSADTAAAWDGGFSVDTAAFDMTDGSVLVSAAPAGLFDNAETAASAQKTQVTSTVASEQMAEGGIDLTAVRSEYLRFDHFQFKLAVIQVLMYELKLMGEPYQGGEAFVDAHSFDYEDATDEELEALKEHRRSARAYFEALEIPSELALKVEDMCLDPSNEIYYEIDPMHGDFDERDWEGRPYYVSDISDRELLPFKNLKGIVFNGFNDGGEELVRKLRSRGIDVQDSTL